MLNVKTILFGLSMLTAGLAPVTPAMAASQEVKAHQASHTEIALDDFNDWFDSLTDRDQKNLQLCFDKMLEKVGGLGSDDTLDDLQDIYTKLARAIVSKVGSRTAKELFSHDMMYTVYLAATTDSASDWIDAVEDADLDLGWSEDDVEEAGTGAAAGSLVGAGVGAAAAGGAIWWAGAAATVAAGPVIFTVAAAATIVVAGAVVGAATGHLVEEGVKAVVEVVTEGEDDE